MRVVVDTNVFVSLLIRPTPKFVALLDLLDGPCRLLYSDDTLTELVDVLRRRKFARYTTGTDVQALIDWIVTRGEWVAVSSVEAVSTDPGDDIFLALAVQGGADCLISGDKRHLLSLGSHRGIPIVAPADFLARLL